MKKVKGKSREDLGDIRPYCPPVALAEAKSTYSEMCPTLDGFKETVSVFWPTPNSQIFNEVSHLLAVGCGPREIAEELDVPYDRFCRWYLNGLSLIHI